MPDLQNLKTLFSIFQDAAIGCLPGWYDLLLDFGVDLSIYARRHGLHLTASSLCSKFARLRASLRCPNATDKQWVEIEEINIRYEQLSKTVCEHCGRRGRHIAVSGVVFTLCPKCHHAKK